MLMFKLKPMDPLILSITLCFVGETNDVTLLGLIHRLVKTHFLYLRKFCELVSLN